MGWAAARAVVTLAMLGAVACDLVTPDPPVAAWSQDCVNGIVEADRELGGVSELAARRAWLACMRDAGATCTDEETTGPTECQGTRGAVTITVSNPWG